MDKEIIFHILIKKGGKAAYVEPFSRYGYGHGLNWDGVSKQSRFSREQEILIQKGSTLRFKNFKKDLQTGKLVIECELIQ